MDIKEKGKQYYLNNRDKILKKSKQYYHDNKDKILEKSKQYYHDNKEERQKYNNEYWALHGHIYMQKRSVDQNMKEKREKIIMIIEINYYLKVNNIIMIIENQYLNIML